MASDPVAEKSSFLCMYMSSHPDTLVAYVKHFGKVSEPVTKARLTAIDTKSMSLNYTTKAGKTQDIVIPISPPLSGYNDVKPRLLSMKAEAQEALGMIKAPQITKFHFPSGALVPIAMLGLLVYCTLATVKPIPQAESSAFDYGRLLVSYVGGLAAIKLSWIVVGVLHPLEALYAWSICRKHTGFTVGAQYVLGTFLFGYPVLFEIRHRIQEARIQSVMKVE